MAEIKSEPVADFIPESVADFARNTHEYTKELTGFPGSRYDDQVDATTQALQYLKERSSRFIVVQRYLRRFTT